MYLQHTIAPGTANGGVCVRTPVPLSSRTLGFGFSPTYVTYFHRVYVDSIYPLSKESSVCVCVCVWIYVSLSLSFSLKWRCVCTLTLALAHPLLSHSLFPFFSPIIPLSLSLSLYVVLPHVSYPTFTCFSHPISICGHRTVKAPYPVRSAKLSTVSTS